ncbi:MAG TPA: hypothetical protein VFQ80_02730 [Thermomicrobiales bacterium]|nr:hypothetical protein [Thermomicrobiales bacterium]
MDGRWFDGWTRLLAQRRTRRAALRGAAAGAAMAPGFGQERGVARAAQGTPGEYVVVRRHRIAGDPGPARQELMAGYAPLLARQPGFRAFVVFGDGSDVISFARFASRQEAAAATDALAAWSVRWLAPMLPPPVATLAGAAFGDLLAAAACPPPGAELPLPPLPVCVDPAEPGRGCPCHTAVPNPCAVGTLLCCPKNPAATAVEGLCVPDRLGCNPTGRPLATQTAG